MSSVRARSLPVIAALLTAVIFWGGNNVGLKFVVSKWPPLAAGSNRFLLAGLLLLGVLHGTRWFGPIRQVSPELGRQLWWRGGLVLAVYIGLCNWTLRLIPATHFALHLAASPIWALLWEGSFDRSPRTLRSWLAAVLTFGGVLVLLWPALLWGGTGWYGECLGVGCCLLWAWYSRECRILTRSLTPAQVTATTMWRAGVLLLGPGLAELWYRPFEWRADVFGVHIYSIVCGGVVAFACWNYALSHWPASRVFLFGNLMPLSTTVWAYVCLGEPFTQTIGASMLLILSGVVVGQVGFERVLGRWWAPEE